MPNEHLVILATQINSLARYSKRTTHNLSRVSHHTTRFQDLFYSLLRVLFSFPSRYSFAIGLKTCLGLEVDASQIRAKYPVGATRGTPTPSCLPLRDCHPISRPIPGDFGSAGSGLKKSPTNPHRYVPYGTPFRLPFAAFALC